MNERIKLLAEQAGPVATIGNWGRVEWADNVYPQIGDRMYAAVDLEKFAELIVRECADMAESFHRHQYDFTGNLELHEFIKTHFGVEE
jgi:hypothetical protein